MALKVGDKVSIYRIPKKCEYWIPEMNPLLNEEGEIDVDHDELSFLIKFNKGYCYIIPKSCVKRVKYG